MPGQSRRTSWRRASRRRAGTGSVGGHLPTSGRQRAGSASPLAILLGPMAAPRLDVGRATSDRPKRDPAVEALRRALVARNLAPGLVHHSDRGSQHCSVDCQALLRKRSTLNSIRGRGTCYDTATVLRRKNRPLGCSVILLTVFKTITQGLLWPFSGELTPLDQFLARFPLAIPPEGRKRRGQIH